MSQLQEFYGHQADSVLALLKQRKESGYDASRDEDGHKVALMFEGGAMAGLVSAAAGASLAELGYATCFDTVYGTSSGALNATYFVAGQAQDVLDVYRLDTMDSDFMGVWRWPDQVNVKWLAERITQDGPRQLNLANIAASATELKVSTTDVETGRTRYFSNKTDPLDTIIPATIASGSTPMFVTHREVIDGREYSDGLVRDGVQTRAVMDDGHTHVVGLLSNPVGRRKRAHVVRAVVEQLIRIRFYPPDFQTAFHARSVFYNDALELLHHGAPGFSSLVICPHKSDTKIGNLEKDTGVLTSAIDAQVARVRAIFGEEDGKARHRSIQESDWYI